MYLRLATIKDADMLLEWANDPIVRQSSFSTHIISREEHYAWFSRILQSDNTEIYILCDIDSVGTVRLNYKNNITEISYSIANRYRGNGYGEKIIQLAEIESVKHHNTKYIVAEVKNENFASKHIFEKLNYNKSACDGHIKYVKEIKSVIGFRADANKQVATGHAMRCITYAKEAIKQCMVACFFVSDDESREFIESKGLVAIELHSRYDDLDGEIYLLAEKIKKYRLSYLVIDSYYVTAKYLATLKKQVKTVYIDDVLSFAYPADIILNYNIYAEEKEYKKLYNGHCPMLLLGTKYAPLREEFKTIKYIPKDKVKNVMITMGGGDRYGLARKIVEYLSAINELSDINFHVVAGAFYDDGLKIERVIVYQNVSDMAQLMADCDIIISAGGFTLYEAYSLGVPAVSVAFADNQLKNVKKFDELGLIRFMGDSRTNEFAVLNNIKNYLIQKRGDL